jgi:hypothetical protein
MMGNEGDDELQEGGREMTESSILSIVSNQGLTATTSSSADTSVADSSAHRRKSSTNRQKSSSTASLDFIGTSHAVKNLFSIPYQSSDQPLYFAVHNLNGTLLIDDSFPDEEGDGEGTAEKKIQHDNSQSRTSPSSFERSIRASNINSQTEALSMLRSILNQQKEETGDSLTTNNIKEYLEWKFQDMNLLVGSDTLIVQPEDKCKAITIRVEDLNDLQNLWQKVQTKSESTNQQQFILSAPSPRSYAQALLHQPNKDDEKNRESAKKLSTTFSESSLDQVMLQTCIVPSSEGPFDSLLDTSSPSTSQKNYSSLMASSATPACIVLDAYLDNIMAQVPQLALCLQEKGLMRSVKILQTEEIPSMMLHPSTLDAINPISNGIPLENKEDLFSPKIMEMNASALLRFLKTNCTRNNATYLLKKEPGDEANNIQLYDISSISTQRQRKWIWWLATVSYRFALRLRHLELSLVDLPEMRKRAFRDRQRSLYQTTLDLLQDLLDMDGSAHESLVASVREHMADTFLGESQNTSDDYSSCPAASNDGNSSHQRSRSISPPKPKSRPHVMLSSPPTSPMQHFKSSSLQHLPQQQSDQSEEQSSKHQPYTKISVDALNKAQDHLIHGIKALQPLMDKYLESKNLPEVITFKRRGKRGRAGSPFQVETSGDDSSEDEEEPPTAIATQLFGLNYKLVNVSLRLADYHLQNYYSSSAMQELRNAGRRMATLTSLLEYIASAEKWIHRLQLQYVWLWEHCGHFARSFASDDLWRDRGHACGDDVISLLRDVDAAFSFQNYRSYFKSSAKEPLFQKTRGMVSLHLLSAVVRRLEKIENVPATGNEQLLGIEAAQSVLSNQGQLRREKREVLVASCISYGRAIVAVEDANEGDNDFESSILPRYPKDIASPFVLNILYKRLGDACNETGKVLLDALRGLLSSPKTNKENSKERKYAAQALLDSAEFWFDFGLGAFETCKDLMNIALLRCNLCQCSKLRANSGFGHVVISKGSSHAEVCLQEAACHLQAAHESLGERGIDPMTWDMVSEELAATFLVLGVRRRQSLLGGGNTPVILQSLRLSPGKERSITEPMEKALEIYEQSGNAHQAAAAHYQLALTNAKIWTCQRDETKTREKLSLSFEHYNLAFHFFSTSLTGNEPTFVLLSLDLASLYAAVSGEECLSKALSRCLDTCNVFSQKTIDTALVNLNKVETVGWLSKMDTLAENVEDRVFKLLRSLVKLESSSDRYKEAYRKGLSAKIAKKALSTNNHQHPQIYRLVALHEVLTAIQAKFE